MENLGKIEKREHTDPELLEAEVELDENKWGEKLEAEVMEILKENPNFDDLSEEERKKVFKESVEKLKKEHEARKN